MTDERWEALDDLGFEFEPKSRYDKLWAQHFNELKEYKKKHGNCRVKVTNRDLGSWVHNQRKGYMYYMIGDKRKMGMTQDRIEKLESIDFEWNVSAARRR
jgi:Helicase associated domain